MKTLVQAEYYKNLTIAKLKSNKEMKSFNNPDVCIGNIELDWEYRIVESKSSFELLIEAKDQEILTNISFDTDSFNEDVDLNSYTEYNAKIKLNNIKIESSKFKFNQEISPKIISFEVKEIIQLNDLDFEVIIDKIKLTF